MDESSLGILSMDEMNTDFPSFHSDKDQYPSVFESPENKEESKTNQRTDADLINLLNYGYDKGDESEETEFKELGLNEEDLALLMGDISDSDNEYDDEDEVMRIIEESKTGQLPPVDFSDRGFVSQGSTNEGLAGGSDVDTETELEAIKKQNQSRISLTRPDLEGKSGVESSFGNSDLPLRLDRRERAEGSPVSGNDDDSDSCDGSSRHSNDNDFGVNVSNQDGERLCPQGIEDADSVLPQIFFQPTSTRPSESYCIRPWADESSLRMSNFQSRGSNYRADGSDLPVVFNIDQISARSSSLPQTRSATYSTIHNNETFKVTSVASTSKEASQSEKHTHNIESNLPTTDLAFYTDFRDQFAPEDFMTDGEFDVCGKKEEFVSASDALKLLDHDEKKFEEASFKQDGNTFEESLNWVYKDNLDITRPSWMSDVSHDRISIGRFLSSKTNPLGTLDGNKNEVERPNFGGNTIVSPRSSLLVEDRSTVSKSGIQSQRLSAANKFKEEESEFVSLSFIDKFIRDASISANSNVLAEQVLKLAKEMKMQKKLALKELKAKDNKNASKNDRTSGKKRTSFAAASTNKRISDILELNDDWEPVRPSSIFQPRTSGFHTPVVASRNPCYPGSSDERAKKAGESNTPSVLIHEEKKKYPTSTPYCGNFSFPMNLSDSTWPSQIADDPTPKIGCSRIEPRAILTINEETMLAPKNEENLEQHNNNNNNNNNNNEDADATITEANGAAFEPGWRLSGGQDSRTKKSDEPQPGRNQRGPVPPLNLFNYKLENENCDRSKEFYPLTHNTLLESEESNCKSPENTKQSFVQLPSVKKSEGFDSYQGLGTTTQLRDCDTVSLQRTSSIRVSSELKFNEVACVGIGCEAALPIQNLTSRWLKCNFQLINLIIDGQSLPTEISPFIFKHETIIEPNSTDKFQVIYASRVPGAVKADLQVSAQPIVQNKPGQSETTTSIIRLIAEAEHPNIEILLDDKRLIDFGTLAEDSCTEINFGLVNVGPASVPIRLSIDSSNKPWQGFYFSKKNLNVESPTIRSLLSSNVISFKMPGQSVGTNSPRVFTTLLAFRAPTLQTNVRESIMSMSAVLNVEVDTQGNSSVVLHSIPMTARIGTVHLETIKDLEPVRLQSEGGKPAVSRIPLRNTGSIPLILEATIPHSPRLFTIIPHSLQIPPGQESHITITFKPEPGSHKISSVLLLTLFPGGPSYEIQLLAGDMAPALTLNLESNMHFLAWGGVPIGMSEDRTLFLRNSRQLTEPCEIQISIRGATEDYWLNTPNGLAQNMIHTVVSQEEIPICVKFSPTSVKHSAGKIVIKPTCLRSNSKQIRFVIPLVGYGGKSKLELIGPKRDEQGIYTAYIGKLGSSSSILYTFIVKNIGDWAAFVKVIPSTDDKPSEAAGKASDFLVSPNEFVVAKQKSVKITLAIRLNKDGSTTRCIQNNLVGALIILYGDEISRKKYRRAMKNPRPEYAEYAEACQAINFDVTYQGEDAAHTEDMPATSNDVQLFYNGINHLQFQLLNEPAPTSANFRSMDNRALISASPPVRELLIRTPKKPVKTWEIWPKTVAFKIRHSDPKSYFVQPLHLQNKINRPLKFDFMWPGHLFSISPANGVIQAKELLDVSVTVIPSHVSEWGGKLCIMCDNFEEEIKVIVQYSNGSVLPTEKVPPLKVLTKEITFPPTVINCSSEFSMEMKNTQTSSQQWILSSVNPAVVKTKDGDMRKVAYSAFRFTKMSGFLKASEVLQVPITFLPLDEGQFIQKWELVMAKNTHRVALNLVGEGISKSTPAAGFNSFQHPTTKKQMRSQSLSAYPQRRDNIQISKDLINFESDVNNCDRQTLQINNVTQEDHDCRIIPPKPPFYVNHSHLNIKRRRFIKLPINFKPIGVGEFKDVLKIETDLNQVLEVRLLGIATR